MIPFGKEQPLGYKAFLLILIRNSAPALGLVLLASITLGMSDFIVQNILQSLNMSGQITATSSKSVSDLIGNIVLCLYTLSIVAFMAGYIISRLTYHFYTFTLEEFDLRLKRGILHLETVSIPYRQIQDVNINRSLFYRILGVSKVIIDSAAHEEASELNETDIILEPINKEIADEIRVLLQRKIGVQVIEKESEADEDMEQSMRYPQK